jgi:NAD(P)-dependent dehydrogenase (short-subunit alcohol dehydrogenase family)
MAYVKGNILPDCIPLLSLQLSQLSFLVGNIIFFWSILVSKNLKVQKGILYFTGIWMVGISIMKYSVDEIALYKPTPSQQSNTNLFQGKVAVVTGANRGIGLATSKWLVNHGAHVIMTCRSLSKCQPIVDEINKEQQQQQSSGIATAAVLDLSNLQSANDLVVELTQQYPNGIHYLFCNAGTTPQYPLTKQGYEDGFGGMHLNHMAIALGLLPLLNEGALASGEQDISRIIMVSSEMAINTAMGIFGPLEGMFVSTNIRGESMRGDGALATSMPAYGRAKLCNILFAMELNRKLQELDWPVTVNAVHTGAVVTDSSRNSILKTFDFNVFKGLSWIVGHIYFPLLWRNVEGGSRVLLCAALSNQQAIRDGGQYLDALCRPFLPTRGITEHDRIPENTINIPLGKGNRLQIFIDPVQSLLVADAKYSKWLWDTSIALLKDYPAIIFANNIMIGGGGGDDSHDIADE